MEEQVKEEQRVFEERDAFRYNCSAKAIGSFGCTNTLNSKMQKLESR